MRTSILHTDKYYGNSSLCSEPLEKMGRDHLWFFECMGMSLVGSLICILEGAGHVSRAVFEVSIIVSVFGFTCSVCLHLQCVSSLAVCVYIPHAHAHTPTSSLIHSLRSLGVEKTLTTQTWPRKLVNCSVITQLIQNCLQTSGLTPTHATVHFCGNSQNW